MNRFLYIVTTLAFLLYPEMGNSNPSYNTVHHFFTPHLQESHLHLLENEYSSDKSTHLNPQYYSKTIQTIVIDPGHGGKDSGTSGKKTKEKDLALAVSKKIGKLIQEKFPEIKVIYTRETDIFVPLYKRAKIANSNNADLFISIHCNYVPNKSYVHGTETFVMGLHRAEENLDIAMRENSVITYEEDYEENYDGYDPNSPESYIIQAMYQNAHIEHSITFANYLEHEFVKSHNRKSRGVKQAGFLVLRRTTMPSVLVELGFLSNPIEENYLASKKGQDEVAFNFIVALDNYINFLNSSNSEQKHQADKIAEKVEQKVQEQSISPVENTRNVVYAIQLCATSAALPRTHDIYTQFQDINVREVNGLYKYYCGTFSEVGTATAQLNLVQTKGYKDAFITQLK